MQVQYFSKLTNYYLLFFLLIFSLGNIQAQNIGDYTISEITADLTITVSDDYEIAFILWLPTEYWEYVIKHEGIDSQTDKKTLLEAVDKYNIFAVMKGEIGNRGVVYYEDYADVSKNMNITDASGERYSPEKINDLDSNVKLLFESFKPGFSKMLGDYGDNINMLAFKRPKDTKAQFKPTDIGRFYVKFFSNDYSYKLPIGVFMPAKYCPVDNEKYKGDWIYCPYHGKKLVKEITNNE